MSRDERIQRQIDRVTNEVDNLAYWLEMEAAKVQRVRDLHQPKPDEPHCTCGGPYPCETLEALDGE